MTRALLIARRELAAYFTGSIAYAVGALFLVVQGFSFWAVVEVLADPRRPAPLGAVLRTHFGGTFLYWSTLFVTVAAIAMRAVAEDRRSGMWESLMTTRVTAGEAVVGKWLGAVAFYALLWAPTVAYVAVLYTLAPEGPALAPIATGYLGVLVGGAAFLAVGVAASAATSNQIVAAFATVAALMGLLLLGQLPELGTGDAAALAHVDVRAHMDAFGRGAIELGAVVFYVGLTAVGLALATAAGRPRRRGGGDWIAAALIALIAVLGNVLAARHPVRVDVTVGQVNTLAPATRRVLAAVHEPVEVLVIDAGSPRLTALYEEIDRLLDRMEAHQPRLRRDTLDPALEPTRVEQLAREFALSPEVLAGEGAVVFRAGDRRRAVELLAMADLARDDLGADEVVRFRAEQAFADALRDVTDVDRPTVCALLGHGELAGEDAAAVERRLRADGAEVEVVDGVAGGVPLRCRALVVLGPRRPLAVAEVSAIDAYLAGGGALLLAIDAELDGGAVVDHGLELVLARFGVRTPAAVVVDPARQLRGANLWGTYDGYGAHVIATAFRDRRLTVWPTPRAVLADGEGAEALVVSSAGGWAESDIAAAIADEPVALGDGDRAGPVPVAVVAERPDTGARVVVLGSARALATDYEARGLGTNAAFAAETVAWLVGGAPSVAVDAKTPEQMRLVATDSALRGVFVVCVVVLPFVWALAGALVWWWRRRDA